MLPRLVFALTFALSAHSQPGDPEKVLQRAISLHQAGDTDGAIRYYREYLQQRPDSLEARSNLGAALAKAGRFDEAIEEYKRAMGSSDQKPNPMVLANLGLAYYKTARFSEAASQFERVLSIAPNSQVTFLLADCQIRLGQYKKAIELLEPFEKDGAADDAFNYLFGTALIRDKNSVRGAKIIDRILRKGDSAEAHLLIGTTKVFAFDYKGALPDLAKAVELNPNLPEAHAFYGQALLASGDQAGGATQFRKELELNPTSFLANLEMGVLAKNDKNYSDSTLYFERALRSRPGDPGVRYQLATIDLATGRADEARQTLETLVHESPQFTEAHVSLATVYYRLKRKEDGDRERAIVQKLTAEKQATEPGAKK